MSESVILCEGFHDRAFWKGWLLYLGCLDLGSLAATTTTPPQILDPWNDPVTKGQFAFKSKSGHFLRVRPCGGKEKILPLANNRLQTRISKRLVRLVVNVDPDIAAGPFSGSTHRIEKSGPRAPRADVLRSGGDREFQWRNRDGWRSDEGCPHSLGS